MTDWQFGPLTIKFKDTLFVGEDGHMIAIGEMLAQVKALADLRESMVTKYGKEIAWVIKGVAEAATDPVYREAFREGGSELRPDEVYLDLIESFIARRLRLPGRMLTPKKDATPG